MMDGASDMIQSLGITGVDLDTRHGEGLRRAFLHVLYFLGFRT